MIAKKKFLIVIIFLIITISFLPLTSSKNLLNNEVTIVDDIINKIIIENEEVGKQDETNSKDCIPCGQSKRQKMEENNEKGEDEKDRGGDDPENPDPPLVVLGDNCAQTLYYDCWDEIEFFLQYVASECSGSSQCPTWTIRCTTGLPAGTSGRVNCTNCIIWLNQSSADCTTLIHELIHAGDSCRYVQEHGHCWGAGGQQPSEFCHALVCSEIRAFHYECCFEHQGDPEGYQDCFDAKLRFYKYNDPCFAEFMAYIHYIIECCLPNNGDCNSPGEIPEFDPCPPGILHQLKHCDDCERMISALPEHMREYFCELLECEDCEVCENYIEAEEEIIIIDIPIQNLLNDIYMGN